MFPSDRLFSNYGSQSDDQPFPAAEQSWSTEDQFHVAAANSEQNRVIMVKQKVNVAFFCLRDKRIEGISQEGNAGHGLGVQL